MDEELEMKCDVANCTAVYPGDETIEAFLSVHLPNGFHAILPDPLGEDELRSALETGTLEVDAPDGAEAPRIVFLCRKHHPPDRGSGR